MKKLGKCLTLKIGNYSKYTPYPAGELSSGSKLHFREGTDQVDSDEEHNRHSKYSGPLNVVEFEYFNADDEIHREVNTQTATKNVNGRKEFSIEIPELRMSEKVGSTRQHKVNNGTNETQYRYDFKEPPAPSHKTEDKTKSFVFPASYPRMPAKKLLNKTINIVQEDHQVDDLKKSFEKERQYFYREKSRYEKYLMVKDGQIEMLQGIITGRIIGNKNSKQLASNHSDHNNQYEQLLLYKDLQITDLFQKITEMSTTIETKSNELSYLRLEFSKVMATNDTLKNQIYVYQKKYSNYKITRQFYQLKQHKPIAPTSRWEDYSSLSKRDYSLRRDDVARREDSKYSGLYDLQKRLYNLKMNRMEFEDRSKIYSEIASSQTTKHRKGFDLKGIFYEREYTRNRY